MKLALPPDTLQFYSDGPEAPLTLDSEKAYRAAFLGGAQEVVQWTVPDPMAIARAKDARDQARLDAEIRVPSSVLYGVPNLNSEQIVYRASHEIEASRSRGRHQALAVASQLWWDLHAKGLSHQQIRDTIMPPWLAKVAVWAKKPIEPQRILPPPRPEDALTNKQQHLIDPRTKQPTPPAVMKPQAIITSLNDVERELLDWLWPGRIPLGKLTLLAGDPGLGKSFVTLDLAARVSRGAAWPDLPLLKQTPGGVVLFNAEDDLADTIAPRLDKAGADDHNIVAIEGVEMLGQRRHFSLECDLPRLAEVIEQHHDTRLVVIDPISAYTGKIDSHNNSEVRGLLAPLAELAGRHRLAIVAVTHLSKSSGTKAVYRAMGSLAFAAAARAVWAIVKDQENPQRRLFLPAKLNLAQDPDGLAYRIVEGRVAWETDPVRMHADDAFAAEMRAANGGANRGAERREAADWLRGKLASGAKPASELIEVGEQCGFTKRTLQRALHELHGERKKGDFNGPWLWSLAEDANEGASSPCHT